MIPECFDELREEDNIYKRHTNMRDVIRPKLKLTATLQFLSAEESNTNS